jgi:ABC-2 type transport system ATP-binding protein
VANASSLSLLILESGFSYMLELRTLTKRYGDLLALNAVSLTLAQGEFFGLLGPNGAGKSTLMSLLSGFRSSDSGEIFIDGELFSAGRLDLRHKLGLVPQSIALYEDLSAEENLQIFGRIYGLTGSVLRSRISEGLEAVQLQDRRTDRVKTFSGGMQRRLNLAAALLHRPKLLLCDEPTVGVDPQSRNAIFEFLQKLNAGGVTVIYSTHYMEEATKLCSRIGVIDHGKILALGTLDELLTRLSFSEQIRIVRNPSTQGIIARLRSFGEIVETNEAYVLHASTGLKLSEFFAVVEQLGLPYSYFNVARPTLEDVFLHLTGKTLRDE